MTLSSDEHLDTVLHAVDGRADVVLLDVDRKPFGPTSAAETAAAILKKTALLTYLDSRVWVEAVEDQVVGFCTKQLNDVEIVIAGDHPRSRFLALTVCRAWRTRDCSARPWSRSLSQSRLNQIRSLSLEGQDLKLSHMKADAGCGFEALSSSRGCCRVARWNRRGLTDDSPKRLSRKTYVSMRESERSCRKESLKRSAGDACC